jgi:hypothetical protein
MLLVLEQELEITISIVGTTEDYQTAQYTLAKFKEYGLNNR